MRITEGEYATTLDELDRYEAWKIIPPGKPYGDRNAMLKDEIGLTDAEARQRVLGRHGGDQDSDTAVAGERGVRYLLDRLKRDRPDLLERLDSGEFRSVRAAAREAGILQPSFKCPADPVKAARRVVEHFQGGRLDTFLAEITRLRNEE
jgi:hypothetical protein